MSSDDLVKISIGLTGAVAGFFLAQFATSARAWLQRKRTTKLLLEELGDLRRETTRLLYFYARHLQLHGAQQFQDDEAIGLSNPIFSNHYKDVLLYLNQNQRISFQMIHNLVVSQNSILRTFAETSSATRREYIANADSDEFRRGALEIGDLARHGYSNCAIIQWHVDFHLKNVSDPDLSPLTEHHKAYLKYLESVSGEMERTIESGKTVETSKFEKIYNPQDFAHGP